MAEWIGDVVTPLLLANTLASTGVFYRLGVILVTLKDHGRRLHNLERARP